MTLAAPERIDLYEDFLRRKAVVAPSAGFDIDPSQLHPLLLPHQRDIVVWAARMGHAAIFASFGLGKTFMQIELVRLALEQLDYLGRGLIVLPLGVLGDFMADAQKLGVKVTFVQSDAEVPHPDELDAPAIFLTNYESVREGKVNPALFDALSLDEAGILRSFGSATFSTFLFETQASQVPYLWVATAVPSPNDYIELLAYSHFLGVMDIGHAKTRFFKRNSTKADDLTLIPHREDDFWNWVATWAVFVQKPSDLGYSDEGYELPELDVRWHEVAIGDHRDAGELRSGQKRLLANAALGVVEASKAKRNSLDARMWRLLELRAEEPEVHRVIWHDLEAEREALESEIPGIVTVFGKQQLATKLDAIRAFANGDVQELGAKPVMLGSGVNFQRHCSWGIYLGIGFKFNDFIQSIHRLQRFQQPNRVRIDLIYTEAEREIRTALEAKWRRHVEMVARMTAIIREYGLAGAAAAAMKARSFGLERSEESGEGWTLVNNDSVLETASMAENSVGLILTSIPFSTQYEYSPSYNDFGHTDDESHFFAQMDFLTPELLRVLKPGRDLVVHCKDRVKPGAMTGLGFQTVGAFHADCIRHYEAHGFAFLGMKTIVTDVVRENNQTYRLGWTEQCKDGSRMGCGLPEYLLLFRKPPTDASDGYADEPVVKTKEDYSRARWQLDAGGFTRSSGDRLLTPDEIARLTWKQIYRQNREDSLTHVYDFEHEVSLGEALEASELNRLPTDFQLMPAHSWHPDVWTDVTRMRTLNLSQWSKGKEMHLCPLQFDIVDRVIAQMSNPGDVVYDPFSGLGTVPLRALKLGRRGLGCELNPMYHGDAVGYLRKQEVASGIKTLFDLEQNGLFWDDEEEEELVVGS